MALFDDLELYLKLDGNANDASDNGRDGSASGIDWVAGKIQQGARYLDKADGITITGWKGITGTSDPISCAFWVKFSAKPTENLNGILYWGDVYVAGGGWRIYVDKSGGFVVFDAGSGTVQAATDICDGEWHLVVVTCPAGGPVSAVKIYVDNAEDTPYTVSGGTLTVGPSAARDVQIGYWTSSTSNDYSMHDGELDEVGIWSKELSAAEVGELWNGGAGLRFTVERGIGTFLPIVTGRGDPEGARYLFDDQPADYMELPDSADELTPGDTDGSYTVVARINRPGKTNFNNEVVFSKWPDPTTNAGDWCLRTVWSSVGPKMEFRALFGTSIYSRLAEITSPNDPDCLLAGVVDGSIPRLHAYLINSGATASDSVDPSYAPSYDGDLVSICKQKTVGGAGTLDGFPDPVYWVAFFRGQVLSQAQLEGLFDGSIKPWDLDPTMYIDFHKPPGSTYAAEIGGQVFDVNGTPVREGFSTFGELDPAVFGVLATARDVPTHPRTTAKNQGEGAILSDLEEKDDGLIVGPWDAGYRANMSHPATARDVPTHPRSTAKDKGIGVVYIVDKRH